MKIKKKQLFWISGLCITAIFCLTLFACIAGMPEITGWELLRGIQLEFKLDNLGKLFAVLTAGIWLLNMIYSTEYMEHEEHLESYFIFYILTLVAMIGVFFSGNLITMYLCYEMASVCSFPFVVHERTKEAIEAAKKYLFYSLGGAFIGLAGFFILSQNLPSLTFIAGGYLGEAVTGAKLTSVLAGVFCILIGFGAKAGMFPMHGWLPSAHPVAPAPASALLSGNLTKLGVFFIIRVFYYLTGVSYFRGTWVQYGFMVLSLLTILMGSMMAYKEKIIKKRLAYSTVSQVSYILFGLSLMHPVGFVGALMHVVYHSLVKNTLFLCAGAIIHRTGHKLVKELKGIGRSMPVTMWCFTLVSVTLVGIPPTSAFISKWYLATSSLSTKIPVISWLGPVVLLTSALLTAGYLIGISMEAFLPGQDVVTENYEKKDPTFRMLVPLVTMTALSVILGIVTAPFTSYLFEIAKSVMSKGGC